MLLAVQEPSASELKPDQLALLKERLNGLEKAARSRLHERGFEADQVSATRFLNLRFQGTDVALMISASDIDQYEAEFLQAYKREFGFVLTGRPIIADDIR